MSYTVGKEEGKNKEWLISTASVRMLVEELEKPEYVCFDRIEFLVDKGIEEGTILTVEKDGEPVGVLGSLLAPNLYNPKIKTLTEIFWYVIPEYRSTRAPYLLIKAFDALAKEVADEATFSLLLSSNNIKIDNMEKMGFKMQEFGFRKEY